jgi:hypothetical protein
MSYQWFSEIECKLAKLVSVPERVPESALIIGLCNRQGLFRERKIKRVAINVLEEVR